ncbi:MAG TPA: bifunctional phosphopantothenoylcysteine decarboxylase/phosphopantothenate--cysteine ligase CoaBC, partial [Thermodesulfobacteriota bacterium]
GETLLVTAGPTEEPIDPVRFLSNRSSGRMGFAVARAARLRGARVILVSGPSALPAPSGVKFIPVRTAAEMREAVLGSLPGVSVLVMAAAVSDYRPKVTSPEKIKKSQAELTLPLELNPDILREAGQRKEKRLLIGFAAETESLLANARKKLAEKNLDLIVANDVSLSGAGFAVDTNMVKLIDRSGKIEELPLMGKEDLADRVLDRVLLLRSA